MDAKIRSEELSREITTIELKIKNAKNVVVKKVLQKKIDELRHELKLIVSSIEKPQTTISKKDKIGSIIFGLKYPNDEFMNNETSNNSSTKEISEEQKKKIEELRAGHADRCAKYAMYGSDTCSFNVFKNKLNPADQNVTIVYSVVSSITNDLLPLYDIVNLMVEPDGNYFNLMDFYPRQKVLEYIQSLEKI